MMGQGIKKLREIHARIPKSLREKLRHSIEIGIDDFPTMYFPEFPVVRSSMNWQSTLTPGLE